MGYKITSMLTLILALIGHDAVHSKPPPIRTYTALTDPMPLHPGQITNSWHKIPLPEGPIAVYSFRADVVSKTRSGKIIPVPVNDAYLHHHVIKSKRATSSPSSPSTSEHSAAGRVVHKSLDRNVGFGAGTESRGTPQHFPYPYAFVTAEGEDEWIANVHIINTRGMTREEAHRCLECPCTKKNELELASELNYQRGWDLCNERLLRENNTACRLESYIGGLRCCEDGDYCLEEDELRDAVDGPTSTYYLRYVLTYSSVTMENKPLELAACCDASGDLEKEGNIEYDIPKCDDPGCVHTLSTIQELHGQADANSFVQKFNASDEREKWVDVVFAVGHLHRGGMEISLYDDITGDLICQSMPRYGKREGDDAAGDELGYIVEMTPCAFDPPLRMRTNHPLRVVSIYNATHSHTGVMGLFYIAISEVKEGDKLALREMSRAGKSGRRWFIFSLAVLASLVFAFFKTTRRGQYDLIGMDI